MCARVPSAGVADGGACPGQEEWATALAIAFLRGRLVAQAGEWSLVERKAVRWLGRRCASVGAPALEVEAVLLAAREALGLGPVA
jgi:hypothetical protein